MIFREYNELLDIDIDEWGNKEYSKESDSVNKYALFGDKISVIYNWYSSHIGEISNIFDKFIVVEDNNNKIAVIISNYYLNIQSKKEVSINPIIINPIFINQGYGTKIIKELIKIKCRICKMYPDYIYAGIDVNNLSSKKIFEKNGFKINGKTEDDLFIYYKYTLK